MKTESFQVKGMDESRAIAGRLIRIARWFQCEPWPDNESRFTVKHEEAKQIENQLATFVAAGMLSWNWEVKAS